MVRGRVSKASFTLHCIMCCCELVACSGQSCRLCTDNVLWGALHCMLWVAVAVKYEWDLIMSELRWDPGRWKRKMKKDMKIMMENVWYHKTGKCVTKEILCWFLHDSVPFFGFVLLSGIIRKRHRLSPYLIGRQHAADVNEPHTGSTETTIFNQIHFKLAATIMECE